MTLLVWVKVEGTCHSSGGGVEMTVWVRESGWNIAFKRRWSRSDLASVDEGKWKVKAT